MIVGVISDSHDNLAMLDKAIKKLLDEGVELVIHLGDIISPFTVRRMKEGLGDIGVIGVFGNNDGDKYLLQKLFNMYGWKLYSGPSKVSIDGRTFIIMHGYDGVEHTVEIARQLLNYPGVDGVLYGHTHKVLYEKENGRILLNPGEICGYITGKSSIAILDTEKLDARIIEL